MLLRVNLALWLLLRRGAVTIEQIKTLYGKYWTMHLFTKLDKLDKFVHTNFDFKIVKSENIYNDDIEYLMVEI